jgi:DNA-binding HxlR family transcriptional regulator
MLEKQAADSNTYNLVGSFRKRCSTQSVNENSLICNCPFNRALYVIGKRWRPVLLWKLANGVSRYGEMRRAIPDITDKVLIYELRNMWSLGLIVKEVTRTKPVKETSYRLTERGWSLIPLLKHMQEWDKADQESLATNAATTINCSITSDPFVPNIEATLNLHASSTASHNRKPAPKHRSVDTVAGLL